MIICDDCGGFKSDIEENSSCCCSLTNAIQQALIDANVNLSTIFISNIEYNYGDSFVTIETYPLVFVNNILN